MPRELHKKDICRVSSQAIEDELEDYTTGDTVIVAAKDERLQTFVKVTDQNLLLDTQLNIGPHTDLHTIPKYSPHTNEKPHLPHNKEERYHFETNSYDCAVAIFPPMGYYQRGQPFLDLTRVVRPGGTIVSITGLLPEKPDDYDAKWWLPNSNDTILDEIVITRSEDFKTPLTIGIYTVTTDKVRYPNAQPVTENP